MNPKLQYFTTSLVKTLARRDLQCPSCGSAESTVVSRKYRVTSLRRCEHCALLFRAPTTSPEESERYYQNDYDSGFTTELPDRNQLNHYLTDGFAGTPKDFSRYIAILEALGARPGDRLLDFGCSWGYGSWQFRQHGFDVVGFEVSEPRAEFARKRLEISAVSHRDQVQGVFDIVFSAHVLEHIPPLRDTLDFLFGKLRGGGLFVSITPNGSLTYRKKNTGGWERSWGLKHPNLLDEVFFRQALQGRPALITSELRNFTLQQNWTNRPETMTGKLDGWELLVACRNQ